MEDKLRISPYSRIKVEWTDRPENYSKESKNKVRNYFANKYGVNKNNINVVYKPVKFNENGDAIEITGAGIENIMDVNYQRALMKELIVRDNKNVDFNCSFFNVLFSSFVLITKIVLFSMLIFS